jgi:DNA polymerase I
METIYILDCSGFLFRSYHAIPEMNDSKGRSTNALFGFIRSIVKLFKEFSPNNVIAVFEGKNNKQKRLEIYPEYKANRSAAPEDLPEQIRSAKKFCEFFGIPCLEEFATEADDVIGSVALWAQEQGFLTYICSADKDLCQVVDKHIHILQTHNHNLILDQEGVSNKFGIPPEKMIDFLALVGDASDNVPGVPGIGPKTAAALLQKFGDIDSILSSIDDVPGKKKQQSLRENQEMLMLARKLVTLDTKIPVSLPTEEKHLLLPPKSKELKDFLLDYSLSSLINDIERLPHSASTSTLPEIASSPALPETSYHLVNTQEEFNDLLTILKNEKEICINTQSSSLSLLQSEIVGIGLCIQEKIAYYVPFNGEIPLNSLKKEFQNLFDDQNISFFAHDVKANLHILANAGLTLKNISWDTVLASYLLNAHHHKHSLENLLLEHFGKQKTPLSDIIGKGKKRIPMHEVTLETLRDHSCEDVDYTLRLKNLLEPLLKQRELLDLFYDLEIPLLKVLFEMEREGIFLDADLLKSMSEKLHARIKTISEEIFDLAGEEFLINSPKQLSHILFEKLNIPPPKKTATGFSTNAEVLESLISEYPIAEKLLIYRSLEKLRSTYVDALPNEVTPHTQRIHCSFMQYVAATGRLSCQNPNLQNIPTRTPEGKAVREAFSPQKQGWSFLAADYSQIELRLLAHFSEDPTLIEAFLQNKDIHTDTAAKIFNVPLEEVSSTQRYQAKTVNFGILYGQQAFGLSKELDISVQDAGSFIKNYLKQYPKVQEFIESCATEVKQSQMTTTLLKRQRAIPEINSKNHIVRQAAQRLAVNTPIQGSAADMIKLAMLKIQSLLKKNNMQAKMILQVHDELIFEAPDEELELLESLVTKEMENILKLKIPLIVNISIGKNWKEC